MKIYIYSSNRKITISFSLLLDVLTIVLRFVISRANRREVMCKNKISKLLEVHAWLHYTDNIEIGSVVAVSIKEVLAKGKERHYTAVECVSAYSYTQALRDSTS